MKPIASHIALLDDPRWPFVLHWWYRKRREVLKLMADALPAIRLSASDSRGTFVELGCGSGQDLCHIYNLLCKHLPTWRFIGCDADPQAGLQLEERLKHHKISSEQVQFSEIDITAKLPFADESVQLVYCSEVLEHLVDPRQLINEVYRILSRNGLFLITTPNQPSALELGYYISRRQSEEAAHEPLPISTSVRLYGHISVKQIAAWQAIWKSVGFRLESVGRGALRYDLPEWLKNYLGISTYFLLEAIADLFPRRLTYKCGSQYIALVRKP